MEGQRRPRVVVVGSYAVGLVMRVARIPVVGETVLGRDFQPMDGGKGSNQAVACARLGAQTHLIAAVGDDVYGQQGLAMLAAEGVDTSSVHRVANAPTGAGFILVDDAANNAIAVDLGANRLLQPDHIDRAEHIIAAADVLLAQLEVPAETALRAMEVGRRHGVRTILNPAPGQPLPTSGLRHVDIITPNLTEARTVSGLSSTDSHDLAQALLATAVRTVVLTLGEQGAWIADESGGRAVPAYRVTARDTTGAGDAFNAALAVALAEGAALDHAVRFACAAGAFSVQSPGTVPSYATRMQLSTFLQAPDPGS